MKPNKVKPTERQKKALKLMVEKGGNKGEILKQAGYSDAVVKTPQKVTESKGWQQLLQQYLPDDLLADVHNQGLKDRDANTRHRYLDTAYKVKKKYDESIKLKFEGLSNEELEERIAAEVARLVGDDSGTREAVEGEFSGTVHT